MDHKTLKMNVNGQPIEIKIDPRLRLIDVLRDKLQLTGTKEGCGEGECGACTVIMEGEIVNSCLVMALQCQNKSIITIEGVGARDNLHPLQESFMKNGAVQCGYCTPGMILAAKALLDKNPMPNRDEIKTAISGNLCRCTGYSNIVNAIEQVVKAGDANEL
ncbi:MAG: (2Fe-2S)-binding protein [Bacillota bacterium]|nr:(2Fe-2S)-binding protein [Bacillota bacterium]